MKNSYRMKKYILDLKVTENLRLHTNYVLLKFTTVDGSSLPPMAPGQFAEVRVDGSPTTFLRRPISINYIDMDNNELWLLIQLVGDGTKKLSTVSPGQTVNMVLPFGNTFTIPEDKASQLILIGGGIGTAPMLYLGYELKQQGYNPIFLLGARSATDILQLKEFKTLGDVFITTEDGTLGEKGYVTQHSVLIENKFDKIYTCGPKPMMMAIAKYAKTHNIDCEVSLENNMACGVGACLCCVEKTTEGHICVCKEGPIFNINKLLWQI